MQYLVFNSDRHQRHPEPTSENYLLPTTKKTQSQHAGELQQHCASQIRAQATNITSSFCQNVSMDQEHQEQACARSQCSFFHVRIHPGKMTESIRESASMQRCEQSAIRYAFVCSVAPSGRRRKQQRLSTLIFWETTP